MLAITYVLFAGSLALFAWAHAPQLFEPGFTLHWYAIWLVIVTSIALVAALLQTRPRPPYLNESEQFDDESAIFPSKY